MLAEEIGGATMLWGGLWLIVSLGVIGVSLRAFAGWREQPGLKAAPAPY